MEYKLEILCFYGDSHKIAKRLLKCYFKHIFIILAASKRVKHAVLIITPRILIPEWGQSNAPLVWPV